MLSRSRIVSGLLAGLVLVGLMVPATAAEAAASGFVISPAFQEVRVQATQPRQQYALQLTNRSSNDQNFRLSVVDFGSLDEEGGVAFLGAPANELEHRYGLASWMTLEKDAVFIPAGQSQQLIVTVDNRPSLAPGGHYAAVLATAVTDLGQPGGDPRVGVKQVLSSLVLAIKEGGGEANLKLVSQDSSAGWWRLPATVNHRFQNTGNIHVTPRGVTELRDPAGRLVARGALNEESSVILPESFRRYKTALQSVGAAWMPGQYVIKTTYRFDGTDKTTVLSTRVWYVGALIWWLVFGVIVLGNGIGLAWFLRSRRRRLKTRK